MLHIVFYLFMVLCSIVIEGILFCLVKQTNYAVATIGEGLATVVISSTPQKNPGLTAKKPVKIMMHSW